MGNKIDKVLPGLYVGGLVGECGPDSRTKLKEKDITHVLSIHDTAEPQHPDDFTYKCIRVSDNSYTDLSPYFSECLEFIHECRVKGGSVFIHCAAGISRSVTITVMYIMTVSTLGFEESLTVVQHCREIANPNYGFRMQLKRYEEGKVEEERTRLKEKYLTTGSKGLDDESELQRILREAREQFGQKGDPHPFNAEAFSQKKSK